MTLTKLIHTAAAINAVCSAGIAVAAVYCIKKQRDLDAAIAQGELDIERGNYLMENWHRLPQNRV